MTTGSLVLRAAETLADVEPPPPLALALEDYLPVILSVIALLLVARWVAERRGLPQVPVALAGVALVAVGGFAKATWKLVYATGPDVTWMDELLFPLLATGFTILAQVVARVDDRDSDRRPLVAASLTAGIGLAAWAFVGFETAETWWLLVMVLASTTLVALLVRQARRAGESRSVMLFVIHLILTFGLAGLARLDEQSWALQWVEQISNTASQGMLALGVWWLWKAARRTEAGVSLTTADIST